MEDSNVSAPLANITVQKETPTIVRPATETPKGIYFLSNLDQTYPYPIEIVLTYKPNGDVPIEKAADIIKESLAQILVKFYPLAGCLTVAWDGQRHVRCTGEGVFFVEASSDDHTLEDLGDVSVVDPRKLRQFVHYLDGVDSILDVPLLTVQITKFRCGGIVLGITMNHVLLDGIALADFLNSWAEITRGLPLTHEPHLNPSVFKPREPLVINTPHSEYLKLESKSKQKSSAQAQQEPLVFKSFCFKPKTLQKLKQLAKGNDGVSNPTSFEVMSALMWVLRTKALKMESDKTTRIITATDVRSRMNPPVPNRHLGNGIVWSNGECKVAELLERPFSFAVKVVHNAIENVTDEYIRSAIDYYEVMKTGIETENTIWITKWSRLQFYDADFGWGKPEQVAPTSVTWNLVVVLSHGRESKDNVMSLGLPESVMESFKEMMQAELE